MGERYFAALLVVLVSLGSLWLAFVRPIIPVEVVLSILLGLLGLLAIATVNRGSGSVLSVFFIAALAYEFYIYLNHHEGTILISIGLLSIVGLTLSMSSAVKPKLAAKVVPSKTVPVKAVPVKSTKKATKKTDKVSKKK
jgi:hypothetical protein